MADQDISAGGYFLERIVSNVGTGDTAKNATMENYWRAKPLWARAYSASSCWTGTTSPRTTARR